MEFNLTKFSDEVLKSQQSGELSGYCQDNWSAALQAFPNDHLDMDRMIELASHVGLNDGLHELNVYNEFVENLKSSLVEPSES